MEEEKQYYSIILRHDTSTQWMANDPILALGEYGVEDDTHKVKRGDGESKWSELLYEDFGLKYIVTFENLNGEIKDNTTLLEAFDAKVDISTFDDVDKTVTASINITNDVEGVIGQITKITKNVATGITAKNILKIVSNDNTVQGYWSIDDYGIEVLNLVAESSISDYTEGHKYFKDHLCFYNKKLYRAHENFVAERKFNESQWVLLASLHSSDIRYDNLVSGLDADTVKDALDELKRRDDRKVVKSSEERIVYGTDELGQQTVIPVDDLRKVDTVNKVKADINKNVQIDANKINYSDANPEIGTIREVLDTKVDKEVAGKGAKIVRDYKISYNEEDGNFTIVKDKLSLEDGTSEKTTETFSVASDIELENTRKALQDNIDQNKAEINERVDNEVATLNTRIDTEVDTLNTTIENNKKEINNRVDNEVETLNTTIAANKTEINNRVDNEVLTLNNTIDNNKTEINNRVDNEVATLNTTISNNKTEIETRVTNEVAALNTTIAANKSDIEQKLADAKSELNIKIDENDETINDRVDDEVRTLNETITTKETNLNNKIDNAVATLNNTIVSENNKQDETIEKNRTDINNRVTEEVAQLNTTINNKETALKNNIDANKLDIENKLTEGLDTKIDRDIADNIITDIVAAEETLEPTIKITRKNTRSEQPIVNHLHFKAVGNIETKFADADHILIDSTEIDAKVQANADQLVKDDARMTAQDVEINALKEHDVNHERAIAANADLIANHETRIVSLEERADGFDVSIADLDAKIENETTNRKVEDAKLETDISRNALNIENNTQAIRDNADNIIELNNLLQENVTNLTQSKLDKDFAVDAGDRVTANVQLQGLTGNQIANALLTGVVPTTKQVLTKTFTLSSSDNTLVSKAITDDNGTVIGYDLATNLDIDVHYFVTSETLNTVIPSANVIAIDTLTATTKNPVEVNDIVSDAEGTWARVQEIDEEAQTITCVTFHKHAQAVWGTVKGDIADQADLQEELAKKVTLENIIASSIVSRVVLMQPTNKEMSTGFLHWNPATKEVTTTVLDIENTDGSINLNGSQLVGDGTNGASKGLVSNTIDLEVMSENVKFDAKTSGLTSTMLAPAVRELKTIADKKIEKTGPIAVSIVSMLVPDSASTTYTAGFGGAIWNPTANTNATYHIGYKSTDKSVNLNTSVTNTDTNKEVAMDLAVDLENTAFDNTDSGLTSTKAGAAIRELKLLVDDKVATSIFEEKIQCLTDSISELSNTTTEALSNKLDKVTTPNIIYGTDENGNQISIDKTAVGKVDTVNNVEADENKNVTLTSENIKMGTPIGSATEEDTLSLMFVKVVEDLQTQISPYMSGNEYKASGHFVQSKFVTITNNDGKLIMAQVLVDFTSSSTEASEYENFQADITNGNLMVLGSENATSDIEVVAEESYNILQEIDGSTEEYEGMGGTEEEIAEIMDEVLGNEEI